MNLIITEWSPSWRAYLQGREFEVYGCHEVDWCQLSTWIERRLADSRQEQRPEALNLRLRDDGDIILDFCRSADIINYRLVITCDLADQEELLRRLQDNYACTLA
jgi:hypothetical protein